MEYIVICGSIHRRFHRKHKYPKRRIWSHLAPMSTIDFTKIIKCHIVDALRLTIKRSRVANIKKIGKKLFMLKGFMLKIHCNV